MTPQWMPEIKDSIEPYIYYLIYTMFFPYTYIHTYKIYFIN